MTDRSTLGRGGWAGLPQPREVWTDAGPAWVPTATARVGVAVSEPGHGRLDPSVRARLDREAERLADELWALGKGALHRAPDADGAAPGDQSRPASLDDRELSWVEAPGPGDVLLRIDGAPGAVAESWTVTVTDRVVVTGADPAGVFRGTRQLLQTLVVHGGAPRGTATGSPAVADRVLHLDAARKHLPAAWIEQMLHEMAYVGVNVLQLHLSEDEGFRVESLRHPEVVSDQALTRAEVRRILEVADDLHVRVDPSFTMPGHLGRVLEAYPDHRLRSADGDEVPGALDITDESAVGLVLDLVDELATLFTPGARWNIGADEFVELGELAAQPVLAAEAVRRHGTGATGFDLLVGLVNRVADVVRAHGFVPQVWNDCMFRSTHVELDPDVVVAWWTGWSPDMAPLRTALHRGHDVVNANDSLFYYVLGENAGYTYPTTERVWERDWRPGVFTSRRDAHGEHPQMLTAPYPGQLLGTMLAVWCDVPDARTADEVATDLRCLLRALAERSWNDGSGLDHAGFVELDRAAGLAPVPPRREAGRR